ncbi:unnamed protein product [Agarophyton chilense]
MSSHRPSSPSSQQPSGSSSQQPSSSRSQQPSGSTSQQSSSSHTQVKCPEPNCKRAFGHVRSLSAHLNNTHRGGSPGNRALHHCGMCASSFDTSSGLRLHTKAKHENVTYRCDHPNCGRTYSQKSALTRHEFENH